MSENQKRRLIDLIVDQAETALTRSNNDNSMPAGHNGPYHNPETPTRNTAHWLVTFSRLYRIQADQRYLDAAERFAAYLADPARRPQSHSFLSRTSGADLCNGLIGQAWAIEGLVAAAQLFDDDRYLRVAREVFEQHAFDHHHGVWHRLEPDGRVIGEDATFNHQLWFATAAAELLAITGETDHSRLAKFMAELKRNLVVSDDGRIRHMMFHPLTRANVKRLVKLPAKRVSTVLGLRSVTETLNRQEQNALARSVGYQCFNLYAFARLQRIFDQHPVFLSTPFRRAVAYLESDSYKAEIEDNPYGYGYNAPGFEVPLALSAFSVRPRADILRDSRYWLEQQFLKTYDPATRMFARNNEDAETLSARVYECSRFPEDLLSLEVTVVSA